MPKRRTPATKHRSLYAVILVGGKGERLKPLSTDERPKPFLAVTADHKTMFRKTVDRLLQVVPAANILVVANERHAALVRNDFPEIRSENLILEPASRNTAPAIALAAAILAGRDGRAIMIVVPSDHHIVGEEEYAAALTTGVRFVTQRQRRLHALVAIAVRPRCPATGFGYVKVTAARTGSSGVRTVERFVEKPDKETAERFVASGHYLWNTGTFIFSAQSILAAIAKYAPAIAEHINPAASTAEIYKHLPSISIDYAVMEKAHPIWCVAGEYGWDDIGSFESLKRLLLREGRRFVEEDGKVTAIL